MGEENFLIQNRNLEKALKYGLFLFGLTLKRIYAILAVLSESQETDNLWGNFVLENLVP
ncbi:MAG: hypothetical protein G01um101444_279 [Parcubacteria group bacterium Gr01-1014_44]|nr:MAG: hypothetical protein G01um101444_279 [Parcubacteria group bacterium Gr01-1014_44]